MIYSLINFVKMIISTPNVLYPTINRESLRTMNLNEECLLKYLQNPEELVDLTAILLEFNQGYTLTTALEV